MKIKEKLEYLKDDIEILIKRITTPFINLIVWFPVIWKDRNWDFIYLEDIIAFKLSRMEKDFKENDPYSMHKKTCRRIRIILEHLKHYRNIDDYTDSPFLKSKKQIIRAQIELENWHYQEFWRKLAKYSKTFWD